MSDYYISVSSDGQPFISHAWGKKQNTKYIARISDGKGGYRYFYSQREWAAYNNKQNKVRDKAENGKKVSTKQFLTGGKEKKSFKYMRKENKAAKRELRSATKDYTRAVKNSQSAYAELREAKKSGTQHDVNSAQSKVTEARKQTSAASQRASSARLNYKKTSSNLKAHQRAYESTSLPGKTHRLVRKGNEKLKTMTQKIGDTPVIYLKKTND